LQLRFRCSSSVCFATCFVRSSSSLGATNFNSLNVLALSTYNFQFLRSLMQLVQFFILSFFYIIPYVIFASVLWSP
jgi:uncharacterized membrane protein